MDSKDQAINVYLKVININKDYYPTYSNLGKCYLEKKEIKNAINILKKCLAINPNFVNAKNNLANAYYQIEKYDLDIINSIFKQKPSLVLLSLLRVIT